MAAIARAEPIHSRSQELLPSLPRHCRVPAVAGSQGLSRSPLFSQGTSRELGGKLGHESVPIWSIQGEDFATEPKAQRPEISVSTNYFYSKPRRNLIRCIYPYELLYPGNLAGVISDFKIVIFKRPKLVQKLCDT